MKIMLSTLKIIRSGKSRCKSGKSKLFLIISFILFGYNLSYAQPGSLDTSFDPGTGADDNVWAISIQSNGKIIIGGYFTAYNGTPRKGIARLNTDGSLDTSFDPGTGADNLGIRSTSIQNDGRIIIGGLFTSYNGAPRNYIARLNTDGSLDTSFAGMGLNGPGIFTTSIQPDGKIIIDGAFTSYNGTPRNHIARLNADGSLDTSFTGTGADGFVLVTSIESDGKIIIGGAFTSYNGTSRNYIARLNTDGSLDSSFAGTGANNWVETTSLQTDGKIIITGGFTSYNGTPRNRIARLNADGSLDPSFDPGTGTDGYVRTASIQSDGKIIIGGAFNSYNGTTRNNIARLVTTPVGINQIVKEAKGVNIFPNPFSSTTALHTEIELKNAELTVYNSSGKPVKQINNILGHTIILNRGNLPGGLYFIRLSQDNQIIMTDKLVITD